MAAEAKLPAVIQERGISVAEYNTIKNVIFPTAKDDNSIAMAIDYCKARKLDIMKRPIHIVPVWDSKANNGRGGMKDTIWPSIAEARITASRTKGYAGKDSPKFGEEIEYHFKGSITKDRQQKEVSAKVKYPEWCEVTVYRMVQGQRCAFTARVRWTETYNTIGATSVPNSMWQKRPYGQIEKCAEAAALRAAFPEEFGNDYIGDEAFDLNSDDNGYIEPSAEPGFVSSEEQKKSRLDQLNDKIETNGDSVLDAEYEEVDDSMAANPEPDSKEESGESKKKKEPFSRKRPEPADEGLF